MSFLSKLAFWKKGDDLGLKDDFGAGGNLGLNSPNSPGNDFGNFNNTATGMPDMTNFRGVGDPMQQQDMDRSIYNQMGPDYMNNSSPNFGPSAFGASSQPQSMPPGYGPFSKPPVQQMQQPQYNNETSHHEIDVISAKLDAIRANLDAINQRLANLERAAYGNNTDSRYKRRDIW